MIFTANPTKQEKNITDKGQYVFYEFCMFEVFIHIIRKFHVVTYNVDDSRSTQEVWKAITNLKQEWKQVNGKTFMLTPDMLFGKYLALSRKLPDNVFLCPITICTA